MQIFRLTFLAALIAGAGVAHAVKPLPPVTVECSTISSSGMTYKAQCAVSATGEPAPQNVKLSPLTDPHVKLLGSVPPSGNGVGKWLLTLEFSEKKAAGIPFEVRFGGGSTIAVGAAYDPFPWPAGKAGAITGVVKQGKNGSRVQEFPSK